MFQSHCCAPVHSGVVSGKDLTCYDQSFFTYSMLRFNIQFAGRLIQYDDLRISNQSSDDGDALLLSAWKFVTTFAYICKDKPKEYRWFNNKNSVSHS